MIKFTDGAKVGEVKQTKEGYLIATARVARTGVQKYLASELGDIALNAGFKPNDIVRVNRPESEVFSDKSLSSITRMPVTIDHPSEQVNADNWAKYAVGDVGDAYSRDGDWIVVNPMIKDSRGILAAQTTHKQISMGYSANIVIAADKAIADFDMTDITYNHQALVKSARAGDKARIGDSWGANPVIDYDPGELPNNPSKGVSDMEFKTLVLGDVAVQVAVTDLAAVESYKSSMTQKLADAEAAKKQSDKEKDEEIGKLKAELKTAKDAAVIDVDSLVAARTTLVSQIKALDASIDPTGKTDAQLRKAAVAAKLGDEAVKDANDDVINGMFMALVKANPSNPVRDAMSHGIKVVGDSTAMQDALNKANADQNAWRYQGGN